MESDPLVWVAVVGLFAAPLAAVITWWLNRGKERVDRSVSLISASGEAVDAIRDVMNTLQDDLERTKRDLAELRVQNEQLLIANKQLVASIHELRDSIRTAIKEQQHPNELRHLLSLIPGIHEEEHGVG